MSARSNYRVVRIPCPRTIYSDPPRLIRNFHRGNHGFSLVDLVKRSRPLSSTKIGEGRISVLLCTEFRGNVLRCRSLNYCSATRRNLQGESKQRESVVEWSLRVNLSSKIVEYTRWIRRRYVASFPATKMSQLRQKIVIYFDLYTITVSQF